MKTFPDNKISTFRTKLPAPVNLNGAGQSKRWEVGLSEILYPKTWQNVSKNETDVFLTVIAAVALPPPLQGGKLKEVKINLPPGLYNSVDDVVYTLNQHLVLHKVDASFDVLRYRHKVQISLGSRISAVKLGSGLQRRLGFQQHELDGPFRILGRHLESTKGQHTIVIEDGEIQPLSAALDSIDNGSEGGGGGGNVLSKVIYVSSRPPDLNAGLSALYVYCNLVQPRPVGDSMVPLLRTVPNRGYQGDTVAISLQPVHYLPVNQTYFDTVEVNIRDDTGELVPFESGRVIITLHFRSVPSL